MAQSDDFSLEFQGGFWNSYNTSLGSGLGKSVIWRRARRFRQDPRVLRVRFPLRFRAYMSQGMSRVRQCELVAHCIPALLLGSFGCRVPIESPVTVAWRVRKVRPLSPSVFPKVLLATALVTAAAAMGTAAIPPVTAAAASGIPTCLSDPSGFAS
jgi:hypothetical protein